jgi:hypothetical protein
MRENPKTLILYVCSSSSNSSSSVGKVGQNCLFDKFSSGSHNNNRDNGLLGDIDFVVNLKSKSPMGGDYFYFLKVLSR